MSNFETSLLEGKMFSMNKKGRNYRNGIPLSSDLWNQVKELAQNYSFPEVGHHIWAGKLQSLTLETQTFDVI